MSLVELSDTQKELLRTVREFVDKDVIPTAPELEQEDSYPDELVQTMVEMGLFGVTIPEKHGGLGLDLTTYALIVSELSRGWMSLSGVLNTHFMAAWLIDTFGTASQKRTLLPPMATGQKRAAFSMTEPHSGSDVQAIHTRARRSGDDFLISGTKMWVTNGLRSSIIMLLTKTDIAIEPPHLGMTAFVIEKESGSHSQPGITVSAPLKKLGYKGVETTEVTFDEFRTPSSSVLGGEPAIGRGFKQFMSAIELGRVNIAARAIGVATAAFDAAIKYSQQRHAFGRPISEFQATRMNLADMATSITAARLLMLDAASRKDNGERADLEAGMAKLFATEAAAKITLDAMRIHGGYGYSPEFVVERLYRDAPLLVIGEGSNEIQRLIISRRLLEDRKEETS